MVDVLNSIACSTCRNKKIKCDRVLPICSQCIAAGIDCTYSRGKRRGMPTGYVSSLEKRLLQTETALFEVLCHVHGVNSDQYPHSANQGSRILQSVAADQDKSDRLSEWEQYPLATEEQRSNWLRARMGAFGVTTNAAWPYLTQMQEQNVNLGMQHGLSPHTEESAWSSPILPVDSVEHHTSSTTQSYTNGDAEFRSTDGEAKRLSDRQSNRYF